MNFFFKRPGLKCSVSSSNIGTCGFIVEGFSWYSVCRWTSSSSWHIGFSRCLVIGFSRCCDYGCCFFVNCWQIWCEFTFMVIVYFMASIRQLVGDPDTVSLPVWLIVLRDEVIRWPWGFFFFFVKAMFSLLAVLCVCTWWLLPALKTDIVWVVTEIIVSIVNHFNLLLYPNSWLASKTCIKSTSWTGSRRCLCCWVLS